MRIIFVIGPAYSGKSIYIRKNFPDARVVNISTFNKIAYAAATNDELEDLGMNAQRYCREALQNTLRAAGEDETVILEHQLLRRDGRDFYVNAVREVTDCPIECIILDPEEGMIENMLCKDQSMISLHLFEKDMFEAPEADEDFIKVETVHPVFSEEDCRR